MNKINLSVNISFGFRKEKEFFIENLVMLAESGMDIIAALRAICREVKTSKMQEIIGNLIDAISSGQSISKALAASKLFQPHVIALIRLGEQSGRLFENLNVIAIQQKKEASFQSKIRSALLYPVFILSVTGIVGIGVAWFILPNLVNVFSQLHLTLPLMTRILIGFGVFLGRYGIIAVPLFISGLGVLAYFLFFFPKTKTIGQHILFNLPGIHKIIQDIEIARMTYIVGSLLRAGVPITDTLISLRDTASFALYQKFYAHCASSIEFGNSFQKTFASYPTIQNLIPSPIQHMIVAGEQSGRLPETFLKISEIFEEKSDSSTKNISVIMEPLLLVIVWLAVVGIALAVIVPIYGLIGGLNR